MRKIKDANVSKSSTHKNNLFDALHLLQQIGADLSQYTALHQLITNPDPIGRRSRGFLRLMAALSPYEVGYLLDLAPAMIALAVQEGSVTKETGQTLSRELRTIRHGHDDSTASAARAGFCLGFKIAVALHQVSLPKNKNGKGEDPVWELARNLYIANPEKRQKEICHEALKAYREKYGKECSLTYDSLKSHFSDMVKKKVTMKP